METSRAAYQSFRLAPLAFERRDARLLTVYCLLGIWLFIYGWMVLLLSGRTSDSGLCLLFFAVHYMLLVAATRTERCNEYIPFIYGLGCVTTTILIVLFIFEFWALYSTFGFFILGYLSTLTLLSAFGAATFRPPLAMTEQPRVPSTTLE